VDAGAERRQRGDLGDVRCHLAHAYGAQAWHRTGRHPGRERAQQLEHPWRRTTGQVVVRAHAGQYLEDQPRDQARLRVQARRPVARDAERRPGTRRWRAAVEGESE
jgi:hypothetical protein